MDKSQVKFDPDNYFCKVLWQQLDYLEAKRRGQQGDDFMTIKESDFIRLARSFIKLTKHTRPESG